MEKKLIGQIELYKYDNITLYPMQITNAEGTESVYIVTCDNRLEEFCQFPKSDADKVRLREAFFLKYDYLTCAIRKDKGQTFGIFTKEKSEKIYIKENKFLYPQDVRVISPNYYICKDVIYSLKDQSELLRIDLGDERQKNLNHLIFGGSIDDKQFTLVYKDIRATMYKVFFVDLEKKEIKNSFSMEIEHLQKLEALSSNELAIIESNGVENYLEVDIYDIYFNKMMLGSKVYF